jgi:hypothetical protein
MFSNKHERKLSSMQPSMCAYPACRLEYIRTYARTLGVLPPQHLVLWREGAQTGHTIL